MDEILSRVLNDIRFVKPLKDCQKECLAHVLSKHYVMAILPTGYGKSLFFQVAPFALKVKYNLVSSVCIILTPLNSIMMDQINSLKNQGIDACWLVFDCQSGQTTCSSRHVKSSAFPSCLEWFHTGWMQILFSGDIGGLKITFQKLESESDRRVSLTSQYSKTTESMVKARLEYLSESNNIIHPFQSGFAKEMGQSEEEDGKKFQETSKVMSFITEMPKNYNIKKA